MIAISLLEKILCEGKHAMWQYPVMYDSAGVVVVESCLAHKVTYSPETPPGGFHMGGGVCLCSFPSVQ